MTKRRTIRESVTYNGVLYHRYLPTNRYFYPAKGTRTQRRIGLHQQIWLDAGRAIPDGWHIHHIDGDEGHNVLDNLECLSVSAHRRHHLRERNLRGDLSTVLAAWRASPEGLATLRQNMQRAHDTAPVRRGFCAHCGQTFEKKTHHQVKWCSAACAFAAFGTLEPCQICGTPFKRKPYASAGVTCSYQCGWVLRKQRKAARVL